MIMTMGGASDDDDDNICFRSGHERSGARV